MLLGKRSATVRQSAAWPAALPRLQGCGDRDLSLSVHLSPSPAQMDKYILAHCVGTIHQRQRLQDPSECIPDPTKWLMRADLQLSLPSGRIHRFVSCNSSPSASLAIAPSSTSSGLCKASCRYNGTFWMTAMVNGTQNPASPKLMALKISDRRPHQTYSGMNRVLTLELMP